MLLIHMVYYVWHCFARDRMAVKRNLWHLAMDKNLTNFINEISNPENYGEIQPLVIYNLNDKEGLTLSMSDVVDSVDILDAMGHIGMEAILVQTSSMEVIKFHLEYAYFNGAHYNSLYRLNSFKPFYFYNVGYLLIPVYEMIQIIAAVLYMISIAMQVSSLTSKAVMKMTTSILVLLSWIPIILYGYTSNSLLDDLNTINNQQKYDYLGGEYQSRVQMTESFINWFFFVKILTALYIMKEYLLTDTIKKCLTATNNWKSSVPVMFCCLFLNYKPSLLILGIATRALWIVFRPT